MTPKVVLPYTQLALKYQASAGAGALLIKAIYLNISRSL